MNKTKKQFQGIVMSDKMNKTIVVQVENIKQHPKYFKRFKVHTKYKIHDEKNEAKKGDLVVFEECRPLSKEKKWKLVQIVKS